MVVYVKDTECWPITLGKNSLRTQKLTIYIRSASSLPFLLISIVHIPSP
jgi:hypothetical protein